MRRYRTATLRVARRNPHEQWMARLLAETGHEWTPQQIAGHRIYDFWCRELGVAVEVDGPDHDPDWDHWRDCDDWRYRRVLVLHVRNHDGADAARALREIAVTGRWTDRLAALPPETLPSSLQEPRRRARTARKVGRYHRRSRRRS